jgi:predicted DNA-binding WGR domain protein
MIKEQWAGHYSSVSENSDKVWAAAYTDTGYYLCMWGRRGARLNFGKPKKLEIWEASREFRKMVEQKKLEGYRTIPFDDSKYAVPSLI